MPPSLSYPGAGYYEPTPVASPYSSGLFNIPRPDPIGRFSQIQDLQRRKDVNSEFDEAQALQESLSGKFGELDAIGAPFEEIMRGMQEEMLKAGEVKGALDIEKQLNTQKNQEFSKLLQETAAGRQARADLTPEAMSAMQATVGGDNSFAQVLRDMYVAGDHEMFLPPEMKLQKDPDGNMVSYDRRSRAKTIVDTKEYKTSLLVNPNDPTQTRRPINKSEEDYLKSPEGGGWMTQSELNNFLKGQGKALTPFDQLQQQMMMQMMMPFLQTEEQPSGAPTPTPPSPNATPDLRSLSREELVKMREEAVKNAKP